jgi:hypothetical protein
MTLAATSARDSYLPLQCGNRDEVQLIVADQLSRRGPPRAKCKIAVYLFWTTTCRRRASAKP